VKSSEDMEIFIKVFYEAYDGVSEDEPYGQLSPLVMEILYLGCLKILSKRPKLFIIYVLSLINPSFPS